MALLNRLFSSRRKQQPQKGYGFPVSSQTTLPSFDFSKDQVRVVLFRECERRGRKLLFDSKAVRKIPLTSVLQCSKLRKGMKAEDIKKADAFAEITNGFGYQYARPPSDVKPLGEMIFGSVAMALRGSTFKVHVGGSPPVLMLTKVSNSPTKRESERGLEDSYGSSINSMNEYFAGGSSSSDSKLATASGSCPLDVPLPSSLSLGTSQVFARNYRLGHLGSLEADSGCCTNSDCSRPGTQPSGSFNIALASPDSRKGSGGSLSSLRRRWLRTASTSLDLDSSQSLTQIDSQTSCSSLPACGDDKPHRRTKLGVAIIINLTQHQKEIMQEFFLEHAALLESMAVRLHAGVERAYCRKELFVSMMFDASCDIEQSVEDLILGPRLSVPVWLGLFSSSKQHSSLSAGFMRELCYMLEMFDTKDTNFFMSTLLTAVLTHHLGWVPTVTPGLQLCFRQSSFGGTQFPCNLADLPKLHPYNPLWAQAMDLYGALGNPLKTSRTIIMSSSSTKSRIENIERMLHIFSYFIRCAAIERVEPKLEGFDFHSSVSLFTSVAKSDATHVLSVDDRTSSSSTLRPLSGKCSPIPNVCRTSTMVNELSSGHIQKPNSFSVIDSISSKSDNCLDVKEIGCDVSFKQPSVTGLRRTMSYSSRMSSSAIGESTFTAVKQIPVSSTSSKKRDVVSPEHLSDKASRLPMNSFGSSCPSKKGSQDVCPPVGKVIFVLGENENLVGLKRRPVDEEINNPTSEGRCKQQEQPLSFSGSEVESGFSECESFELSPVRKGTLITSHGQSKDSSAVEFSADIEQKLWSSKNEKNLAKLGETIWKDDAIPFRDINSKPKTIHSAFIQGKNSCDSDDMKSANLRSLARSLSVNLPVCVKSIKHEFCANDVCVACGRQIGDVESKENMHPIKESNQIFNKRSMRRLRRAHSSFCVQSQSKKSLKNSSVCQNCNFDQENPCSNGKGNHTGSKKIQGGQPPSMHQDTRRKPCHVVELPLPESIDGSNVSVPVCEWGIAGSLFGGVASHYIPERVLQGCAPLGYGWEVTLKRDLALDAQYPILDPCLSEAVAIVANLDSCEVQLISSHTYVVDRPGTFGVRAGLSQLVANMLESVYHMWKLHASAELCLSFLESRLQEMLLRSQALSELLLSSEFCDMDTLTTVLSLDPNDVPLLLSVASTHSPEVTQRYGLSFR